VHIFQRIRTYPKRLLIISFNFLSWLT